MVRQENGWQGRERVLGVLLLGMVLVSGRVWANGGPFVIKYPQGDPATKGVLARLDPGLKPARETRLRVVKEDLGITFSGPQFHFGPSSATGPLVHVKADYLIENPLDEEIEIDFGFPILRGIYVNPVSMMPRPDVRVTVDGRSTQVRIISNSAIYGLIRRRARKVIDSAIKADPALAARVAAVSGASEKERGAARTALATYLTAKPGWGKRDAALMVEFAGIDLAKSSVPNIALNSMWWARDMELQKLTRENLGVLAAIGEQKATQCLALLAARLDPQSSADAGYEGIFKAWGGDVRERALDLGTGKIRPREVTALPAAKGKGLSVADPTVYARVDFLELHGAKLSAHEKASCQAILKNLPVIFTFAPMNLLHYRVKFPARKTQTVSVQYSQYAFRDTRGTESYQLSYLIHPASIWQDFGPINLTVKVPESVTLAASVPCTAGGKTEPGPNVSGRKITYAVHTGQVMDKTGELLLAVEARGWRRATAPKPQASKPRDTALSRR